MVGVEGTKLTVGIEEASVEVAATGFKGSSLRAWTMFRAISFCSISRSPFQLRSQPEFQILIYKHCCACTTSTSASPSRLFAPTALFWKFADFLRGRYQVLFSLIFQDRLFKKSSGYPFENNGCVFCTLQILPPVFYTFYDQVKRTKRLHRLGGGYRIPLADYTGTACMGGAGPAEMFYTCIC